MKRAILTTYVTVFAVLMAVGVYAQPGGGPGQRGPGGPDGPPPGGPGIGAMLRNDEIKTRLNLSEEQVEKLQKISDEAREQYRRGRGQGRGRMDGERPQGPPSREEMENMRAEMLKRQAEVTAKINAVLMPEQQEKFKVLTFQIAGGLNARSLNAEMLEVVKLTDEQKKQILALEKTRRDEFAASFANRPRPGNDEDRRAFGERMRAEGEKLVTQYREKIKAILTPEQLEKAEKLTEEGKSLRPEPRERGDRRGQEGGGPREEGYQPGNNSWQPGQGTPKSQPGEGRQRRFPRSE